MATIKHQGVIAEIIEGGGYYPGDEDAPPAVKIVEYTDQGGHVCWGVIYEGEDLNRYSETSAYRTNPKTIWTKPIGTK